MYRVIRFFTDAQDSEHAYFVGDTYPRKGVAPSDERIKNLLSGNNFQKVPLIELVKDAVAEEEVIEESKVETKDETKAESEVTWTAEEIQKMPFMKLKSIAKKNDVEVKDREAKDIRADLIEKLGL